MIRLNRKQFLEEEISCFMEHDPSLKSKYEVYFMPGFKAIRTWYRTHQLYEKGHYFWARFLSLRAQQKTGIDIHPGATIGRRFFIDHGVGVVIGETCIIKDDVMIYQGVTLGGTGKVGGKRHPTVEDRVLVGAGAKIIGNITLGHDSKVGAGAIVIRDVDPFVTVVSPPAYPVRDKRNKLSNLCHNGRERWSREDIDAMQKGQIVVEKPCKIKTVLKVQKPDGTSSEDVHEFSLCKGCPDNSTKENQNPDAQAGKDCSASEDD